MATFTNTGYDLTLNTDAKYRALWGDVDSHIRSLGGWTYQAQTGDGDPSTVAEGANGTYACFRVYSTSVGSETWYLRIDFGHDANGPALKFQIGSGVNGSGVLTGQLSTQQTLNMSGAVSGTVFFLGQAAGRMMLYIGDPTQIRCIAFSLCGGLDGSGAMSSGMDTFCITDASMKSQCVPASGTVPRVITTGWPCNIDQQADKTEGGNIAHGHPFLWDTAAAHNPTLAVAVIGTSNGTTGLTTTLTLYGSSHTFLVAIIPFSQTIAGSANNRPCWLFE